MNIGGGLWYVFLFRVLHECASGSGYIQNIYWHNNSSDHIHKSNLEFCSSPQSKNSVIIYSPSCFSKPVWHFFFCRTQKKPFWKMFQQFLLIYWKSAGSKTTLDPNDFYCMNLKKQTLKHFFKYILLCSTKDEHMMTECSSLHFLVHVYARLIHLQFFISALGLIVH